MALRSLQIHLNGRRNVPAVVATPDGNLDSIPSKLALSKCKGSIAIVGGAAGFDKPEFQPVKAKVHKLLQEVADLAMTQKLAIIDGGTPYGYMKIMGEVSREHNHQFPLIGVAPRGKVTWDNRRMSWVEMLHAFLYFVDFDVGPSEDLTRLDVNHTAFVLVDTYEWGGEVKTLAALAYALAEKQATVEILINGGLIARQDVATFLAGGKHVIVVEGTGRFADELATAYHRGESTDPEIQAILATGRIHTFTLEDPPSAFRTKLTQLSGW